MDFLNKFDKQQVQKITLIVIAALTILALVLLLVIIIASVNPAPAFGISDGFSNVVDYTVTEKDLQTGSLVVANEDHSYNVAEEWLDLVEGCQAYRNEQLTAAGIDPANKENLPYIPYRGMRLSTSAMAAAHNMLTDAKNATGERAVTIDATYGYIVHGDNKNQEFNTGLLLYLSDYDSTSDNRVALSKEYRKWFDENAANYGFIESFEDGYRYVGVAHAKSISGSKDIGSVADYVKYLKENTSVNKTIEIEVDGATYKIYYAACTAGESIKVPADKDYTISGTNEGGVIVTVKTK